MFLMNEGTIVAQVAPVTALVEQLVCQAQISRNEDQTVVCIIGNLHPYDRMQIEQVDGALCRGTFEPHTSPYSFQRLGGEGLSILDAVRCETDLAVISEMTPARMRVLVQWVT